MWRKGVTVEALEYNYLKVDDFTITRQFEALVNPGIAILNKKDLKEVRADVGISIYLGCMEKYTHERHAQRRVYHNTIFCRGVHGEHRKSMGVSIGYV